jgi:hypothetical protein
VGETQPLESNGILVPYPPPKEYNLESLQIKLKNAYLLKTLLKDEIEQKENEKAEAKALEF